MTRFLIRLISRVSLVSFIVVLLALAVGRILPYEEEILFSTLSGKNNFEIYKMALTRNLMINLTRRSTEDAYPVWSPSGHQIAFVRGDLYSYTIYLMDEYGRNLHRLTNEPQDDSSPVWSPDGRSIAFVSNKLGELMLAELQSGVVRRLTHNVVDDTFPSWLSDSRHLTFISGVYPNENLKTLILDIQTGEIHPFITTEFQEGYQTWSPDGRYLLREIDIPESSHNGIYLWDTLYKRSIFLFSSPKADHFSLMWSPDSQFIVFTQSTTYTRTNMFRLEIAPCLKQLDSCVPELFMSGNGYYSSPRWRPRQP